MNTKNKKVFQRVFNVIEKVVKEKTPWQKKYPRYNREDQTYYSVSNKLRKENKITEEFEVMLRYNSVKIRVSV